MRHHRFIFKIHRNVLAAAYLCVASGQRLPDWFSRMGITELDLERVQHLKLIVIEFLKAEKPGKFGGSLLSVADVVMDAILVAYFFKKKDCVSTFVDDFETSKWNSTSEAREIRHIELNYQTYGLIALRKGVLIWILEFWVSANQSKIHSHDSFLVIPSIIISILSWFIFWAEKVSRDPERNPPVSHSCFLTNPKFYRSWLTNLVPSFAFVSRSVRTVWFGWKYRKSTRSVTEDYDPENFYWQKWVSEKQHLNLIQGTVVIEGCSTIKF